MKGLDRRFLAPPATASAIWTMAFRLSKLQAVKTIGFSVWLTIAPKWWRSEILGLTSLAIPEHIRKLNSGRKSTTLATLSMSLRTASFLLFVWRSDRYGVADPVPQK